jgi:hypothetical protein
MLRRIDCSMALAAVALLTACSSKPAADPAAATSTTSTTEAAAPAKDGVKVFIDPTTGEIRDPTPEDIAALEAEQRKATAAKPNTAQPPRQIVHPDGTVEVILDSSHEHALQGCVQKDGSIKMEHRCPDPAVPADAKK